MASRMRGSSSGPSRSGGNGGGGGASSVSPPGGAGGGRKGGGRGAVRGRPAGGAGEWGWVGLCGWGGGPPLRAHSSVADAKSSTKSAGNSSAFSEPPAQGVSGRLQSGGTTADQ